ncbi:Iron-sulfur assembly protein-like protein [Hapsidospora chrysogenum ATCC 11550]|uniref:Iron-sulfur assembly protein 1 n=1 Tax=Hapsidospora chrysogenum (strain ATCC 11550 / CBS 779.69 / DSM 880 / IAM 14645 / JCM 23072 / IMI 49137) TaxID=857340 RepID=A0A086SUB8_HAPC1|nr:Iron-sulfur assembly protein-like protein [Hapsidospora chrysogenum ATCC 11550]
MSPSFVARAALRQSRVQCRRLLATPSTAVASYHAYSLPSRTTTAPPRNDDIPETSIAQPERPLPKVHETRPPPKTQQTEAQRTAPSEEQQQSQAQSQQPTPQQQTPSSDKPATETEAQAQKPKPRQRPKLRPRKAAMKLTPAAVEQLRALLDQPEPKLIKIGVRNRGCSGLAYHLEYVDKPAAFDEAVEQDGVKVLVDSKALFSIIGSEMDWAEDKLNQRFVFRNPNIKEECGCGESFMV